MAETTLIHSSPLILLGLGLAALAAPARTQGARASSRPQARSKPPLPPSWPKLTSRTADRVKELISLLRSHKEKVRLHNERELTALGPGVAPALLRRLSDHSINSNESLMRVLDRVTRPKYAPLLAKELSSHNRARRIWLLKRLASWHRKEMAPLFRQLLRDKDSEVAFRAAVALTSAGDLSALDRVFHRCARDWHEIADWVAPAISGGRSLDASTWLLHRIAKGGAPEQITALRLLRSLGEKTVAGSLAPLLDSEQHSVKKEAINTLRALVDGKPPLEAMTVFQAINLANAWKKRL